MGKREKVRRTLYRAAALLLAVCVLLLLAPQKDSGGKEKGIGQLFLGELEEAMLDLWCPAFSFAKQPESADIRQVLMRQFPVLRLYGEKTPVILQSESAGTYEDIVRAEGQDEYTDSLSAEEMKTPETSEGRVLVDGKTQERIREENERAQKEQGQSAAGDGAGQTKSASDGAGLESGTDGRGTSGEEDMSESGLSAADLSDKVEEYQWEYYRKYDALVKEFYAVDASTAIDESQLNLDALLLRDMSIQKREDDKPQILIYHTHSQEDFADSVPGDMSTTIMGVGEVLAQILREQYGYNVMHHLGQYDVENRDYAYNNSLPELEKLLAENPGIEVVIDLHRDEVAGDKKLVTDIDGRPTAMFMFFNGLSRTRKHGDIEYLPNANLQDNLAFSFQMQALCNQYYPGLTRRIYLKGYRYNMHLKPRYLLIEMGAQTNTYEECYNACIPLARMLDMELSGADFGYDGG